MKTQIIMAFFAIGMIGSVAHAKEDIQKVTISVTENGFEPAEIKVKAGSHVILQVTRTTDATCSTAIQIKEKKIKKDLPLNQEVSVDLGTLKR